MHTALAAFTQRLMLRERQGPRTRAAFPLLASKGASTDGTPSDRSYEGPVFVSRCSGPPQGGALRPDFRTVNHMERLHGLTASFRRIVMVSLLVGIAATCACSKPKDRGTVVRTQRTQAILAALRASELTFFGDTLDGRRGTYFTRHGASLAQHTFTETGADFDVDIDSTGKLMVFASTRHNPSADVYLKPVDGVSVTQLTSDPAPDIQPAFSPDNTRVAFASHRGGTWDIWIAHVNGDPPIRVTQSAADEIHPSWSPDGTKLVYCSLPASGGQWELWIADASAGGQRRFIGYGLFPEWSPQSDTIVFQRARDQGERWFSIWTVELVDGEPRYPTEVAASAHAALILPSWSADGSHIAFSRVDLDYANRPGSMMMPGGAALARADGTSALSRETPGAFDIWIMRADGREMTRLTDGFSRNYGPSCSPSGRVFFTSDRTGFENIWSAAPGQGFSGRGDVTRRTYPPSPAGGSSSGLVKDGL